MWLQGPARNLGMAFGETHQRSVFLTSPSQLVVTSQYPGLIGYGCAPAMAGARSKASVMAGGRFIGALGPAGYRRRKTAELRLNDRRSTTGPRPGALR